MGRFGEISANAVFSGTVDELGGGKFANGAVTGAFSIMFNDMMHPQKQEEKSITVDLQTLPHSEMLETAATATVLGTSLLADDFTGAGVLDDPVAAACFIVAEGYGIAYVTVTTVDAFKNLYHVLKAVHRKNVHQSNYDKHTKHRSGASYGHNKNQKRGNKNKKHEHPVNPNKRRK